MRVRGLLILLGLLFLAVSGCSGEQAAPITPAQDKLTFVFFFTEG